MKHKRNPLKLILYIGIGLILFGLSAATTVLVMKRVNASTPAVTHPTGPVAGTPEFSFAATKAPGWHQGPSDKTSLAVFSNDVQSGCWASIDRRPPIVSEAAELQKVEAHWAESGYTVTEHDAAPISIPSNADPIHFTLHQYTVAGKPGEQVLGGQEFAYFPFLDGSLRVQAYCNDADQLSTITPALQALSFKK